MKAPLFYDFLLIAAAAATSLSAPRMDIRFTSFMNACPWGDNATKFQHPPLENNAAAASPFTNLPLINGVCAHQGRVGWSGCWVDQLSALNARGSQAMLLLETSGPIFCNLPGHRALLGDIYICPDDCNDPGMPDPGSIDYKHGTRGPGAGTCGLEWIRRSLKWTREQLTLSGTPQVVSVMIGDELGGLLELSNYSAVSQAVHEALAGTDHFVYTNEGTHAYGPAGWASIPSGIDVISMDGYGVCTADDASRGFCDGVNQSEAGWHRQFYKDHLYPKLLPHQRAAVVPGLFGCATPHQQGGCEANASVTGRCLCFVSGTDLSHAGQESRAIGRISEYLAWAADDPMLVGVVPWHYGTRPSTSGGVRKQFGIGAMAYPKLMEHLLQNGWRNSSQFPSPENCNLF